MFSCLYLVSNTRSTAFSFRVYLAAKDCQWCNATQRTWCHRLSVLPRLFYCMQTIYCATFWNCFLEFSRYNSLLCSGSVKFGCSRGRTLNFYTQNYQESLNLKLLSIRLFQKISKLWSFRIAVLPRGLKLVLGGSHLIYIWTFCPLSCCSSLRGIILLDYCPLLASVSVPFPGGPIQRLRSLKTSIGVKAYCLPEDETIGEFGFLLQLFWSVFSVWFLNRNYTVVVTFCLDIWRTVCVQIVGVVWCCAVIFTFVFDSEIANYRTFYRNRWQYKKIS